MVTEGDFNSAFDYSSAFKYGPSDIDMKSSLSSRKYKSAFSYHAISIDTEDNLEVISKETLPSTIFRNVVTAGLYFMTILSFPLSGWMCLKKVQSLERMVLMRLGKLQPVKGPGFVLVLPFVDKWTRIDLRSQKFTVSSSQLLTADKGIVEIKTDIEYRVSDVMHYVLKLENQEQTLKRLALFCINNIVSEKDLEDLEIHAELISNELKDELNQSVIKWGLEVAAVKMHSLNILKAAEPMDAIGTIMSALKAATGSSSQHSAAMFPLPPENQPTSAEKESPKFHCEKELEQLNSLTEGENVMEIMEYVAHIAMEQGLLAITATFKFEIVGRSTKIIFLVFDNGKLSVLEEEVPSEVQLKITLECLNDILHGEISPLMAYFNGKVSTTGDWKLLSPLSDTFTVCKDKFTHINVFC